MLFRCLVFRWLMSGGFPPILRPFAGILEDHGISKPKLSRTRSFALGSWKLKEVSTLGGRNRLNHSSQSREQEPRFALLDPGHIGSWNFGSFFSIFLVSWVGLAKDVRIVADGCCTRRYSSFSLNRGPASQSL